MFDDHIDRIHKIIQVMCTMKGVFHIKAHYSSSQLTCWFFDDPYDYKVYVQNDVLDPGFLNSFPDLLYEGRQPNIEQHRIGLVLDEFKRLRLSDEQIYLRSASMNRLNGMIGMNFSCDGSHYLQHDEFFQRLQTFGADSYSCG